MDIANVLRRISQSSSADETLEDASTASSYPDPSRSNSA